MTRQETDVAGLYLRSGGTGETTYLLLHGLGATGEVWQGLVDLIERNKAGRWLVPDFRGGGEHAIWVGAGSPRPLAKVKTS